eukprot:403330710
MEALTKSQLDFSERKIFQQLAADTNHKRQLESKLTEYEKLSQTLIDMSQKSTNHVMVPLSEVGFFTKGKVKHSNEVLVFLGDNYFAERTAFECQDIIQRRKDLIQNQIDAIDKQIEKEQGLSDLLSETQQKFLDTAIDGQQLPDTESRWTRDGLFDIREEEEEVKEVSLTQKIVQQEPLPQTIYEEEDDDEEDFQAKFERMKNQSQNKNQDIIKKLKGSLDSTQSLISQSQKRDPANLSARKNQSQTSEIIAKSPSDLRKMMEKVAEINQEEVKASLNIDQVKKSNIISSKPKSILKTSSNFQTNPNDTQIQAGPSLISQSQTVKKDDEAIIGNVVERDFTKPQQTQQQVEQEEEKPKRETGIYFNKNKMNKSFANGGGQSLLMQNNREQMSIIEEQSLVNLNNNAVYFPYAQSFVNTDPGQGLHQMQQVRLNLIDDNPLIKIQNEYSEQSNKSSQANRLGAFGDQILGSPTSTPLVMAMGRLHQQSSMQMRKFDRIQGKTTQNNPSQDFQPVKNLQRDSNSMYVNSKKQKLLQKYNMVGFDANRDQFTLNKVSNKTTINYEDEGDDEFMSNNMQQKNRQQMGNWNQNMQKRNQQSLNIYNHRSNISQQNQMQQYNGKIQSNKQSFKNNQNKSLILLNNLPEIPQQRNSNMKLAKLDDQISNQHYKQLQMSNNPSQKIQIPLKSSLKQQYYQSDIMNSPNFQEISPIQERNKKQDQQFQNDNNVRYKTSQIKTANKRELSQIQNKAQEKQLNKSFNENTQNQPAALNKSEMTKSQAKLRKSYMNMKIDTQKLEILDNEQAPIEKRQEIIYNILKRQLDKQRREILHYKKMKRELERAKIAMAENQKRGDIISDKEMARIKYQQERLSKMSPEMIRVIDNLTQKKRHNKYCKCCKYDKNNPKSNQQSQDYDPEQMSQYMNKIKMLNQKLHGGKSMKNIGQAGGHQKDRISLRDMAYHESRNDNFPSQNNRTNHSKNISDNRFNNKKLMENSQNQFQKTAGFQTNQSPDTTSYLSKNNKSQNSREARDRLLGIYNKHRHICSTNHSQLDPFRHTQSARKSRGKNLEYVDLELRPISEPPSVRSICLSALDLSYRDMSQQVDPIEVNEQIIQTINKEVRSVQMDTMFSGRKVDKCIETEKEIAIKGAPDMSYGIIEMSGELNHDEPEYFNYDWKLSGLYSLIRNQYDEMRTGKDLLSSQKSLKFLRNNQGNPNDDTYENMQDASASQYTKYEIKYRELDAENLNPDNEEIYNEMEVQYMASLLKKKAQSYNQKEILQEIHVKAMKTLEVLNNNLVVGDIAMNSIFNFYKGPQRENIIRLLLRCKKMYEARVDVKKILMLMITQSELFKDIEVLRELEVKKYKRSDMDTFQNGLQLLSKIQRELNIFKQDHKIFRAKFIFNNLDLYNEIPLANEDLQLFMNSIKQIPIIDEKPLSKSGSNLLKVSNSSAQLRLMNPKAYKETFKVYEEESLSMMTESKIGFTQQYSQEGGLHLEDRSQIDNELNNLQYSIDATSDAQTPKVLVKYDEKSLIMPSKIIQRNRQHQQTYTNKFPIESQISIVNQQEKINQRSSQQLFNSDSVYQNINSLQPNQINISDKGKAGMSSTRTSQKTRIVEQTRYKDCRIKEEHIHYQDTSQFNDDEIDQIQLDQDNSQMNDRDEFELNQQSSFNTYRQLVNTQDIIHVEKHNANQIKQTQSAEENYSNNEQVLTTQQNNI